MVRASFGNIISLNSIPATGYITDNLVALKNSNNFIFQFSGAYFFNNFGIGSSIGISESNNIKFNNSKKQFVSAIKTKYSDNYFVRINGSVM
jgi:hypothetical protein